MKNFITTLFSLVALFAFGTASAQNQNTSNDKSGDNKWWPVSTKSEEAKSTFREALTYLWNARFEEYQKKITETLNEDPDFFLANANAAINQFIDSKGKETDKLDKALGLPQDNLTSPEKIVRKVIVNLKENKKNDVKGNIEQMLNEHPDILQSYEFAMGMSGFILEDKEAMVRYATMATEKFPDHGPAWNQLGYHYMDNGNMEKAEEAFNNYLKANPDEANAHDSYGDFLMKKGNYAEAGQHYEKAVNMGMTASRERAEKARTMAQGNTDDSDR